MSLKQTLITLILIALFPTFLQASESFKKAEDFFTKGKYEMALLFYNKEITENPDNGIAYFHRGKIHFYNKAYTNSLQDFKKASDLLSKDKKVIYAKANAYAMTGQIDESISEYKRLLKMDKKFAYAHLNLGNIYLRVKKDKESTIQNWETFLEILPNYEQAEDIRKAIEYLRSEEFSWDNIDPLNNSAANTSLSNQSLLSNQAADTSNQLDLDSILPDLNIEGEGTKADVSKQKGMADKKSIETE